MNIIKWQLKHSNTFWSNYGEFHNVRNLSYTYVFDLLLLQMSMYSVVHKRMFYIRMNLRMLQHSNVKCNIRMLICDRI